jgi:hypothetical protein
LFTFLPFEFQLSLFSGHPAALRSLPANVRAVFAP